MGRGRNLSTILQPLNKCVSQCYLGTGLHTLGLLNWILQQTGRADVYVSTFSTSEAFLNLVRPKAAVISTSTEEKASTPARRVLRLLEQWNVEVLQTQHADMGILVTIRDGEVTAEVK